MAARIARLSSRVNPEVAPRIRPLPLKAGTGMLTTCNRRDAEGNPLRAVMAHEDLSIDLAGSPPDQIVPALTEPLLVPTVNAEVVRALGEHRFAASRATPRHGDATPQQPVTLHQHSGGESS
ncbi:hypothetical protein [Mycobacterium sp. Lab-001]|uniref:hypothetical protein n=1 Tax=Mycobacterium sp. Lab-001 TaxID=3410136 RepID=UPI003D185685